MEDRKSYPVFIKEKAGAYLVYVPDMQIYTEGDSFDDAVKAARDAISLKGVVDLMCDGKAFPSASTPDEAEKMAKADADEDFDYSDGVLIYVTVNFTEYMRGRKGWIHT